MRLEQIQPFFIDQYILISLLLACFLKSLIIRILNQFGNFFRKNGSTHIKEVGLIALAALRIFVREIWFQLLSLKHRIVQFLDTDLIIFVHRHKIDLVARKELLWPGQDHLHMIFSHHRLWETIQLLQSNTKHLQPKSNSTKTLQNPQNIPANPWYTNTNRVYSKIYFRAWKALLAANVSSSTQSNCQSILLWPACLYCPFISLDVFYKLL